MATSGMIGVDLGAAETIVSMEAGATLRWETRFGQPRSAIGDSLRAFEKDVRDRDSRCIPLGRKVTTLRSGRAIESVMLYHEGDTERLAIATVWEDGVCATAVTLSAPAEVACVLFSAYRSVRASRL